MSTAQIGITTKNSSSSSGSRPGRLDGQAGLRIPGQATLGLLVGNQQLDEVPATAQCHDELISGRVERGVHEPVERAGAGIELGGADGEHGDLVRVDRGGKEAARERCEAGDDGSHAVILERCANLPRRR